MQFRKVLRLFSQTITSLKAKLTSKRLPIDTNLPYHKHSPGDGLHLINDNVQTLEDGREQRGDPSDICIVANAQTLCLSYGFSPLWLLWSDAYPDDPMDANDLDAIVESAAPYLNEFDPLVPETRDAILKDLRAIKCDELADALEQLLKPFTQVEKMLEGKKDTLD